MSVGPPVVAITGPTATGKTALSIRTALELGGEIISMDSRQVYRGMDIGTAKATAEQQAAVPHHGLDLVDPDERFSAGRFARYARGTIEAIGNRGRLPILVGGTGFFLRALTNPIFREPHLDPDLRARLADYLESLSDGQLLNWLRTLDPASAARLTSWGGRQRRLRALEIALLTGRPITWWHEHAPPEAEPLHPLIFVLELDRGALDAVIDERVDRMVADGLVDEVGRLLSAGFGPSDPGMNATGYVELLPYFGGEISLDTAIAAVRRNTRAYARRQMTWFRNRLPEGAVRLDAAEPIDNNASRIVTTVRSWLESRHSAR